MASLDRAPTASLGATDGGRCGARAPVGTLSMHLEAKAVPGTVPYHSLDTAPRPAHPTRRSAHLDGRSRAPSGARVLCGPREQSRRYGASAAAHFPPVRRRGSRYGYRVRLTIAAIMVAVVLTAGCSDDDDTVMAPTTSEQTTTSQPPSSDLADCPRRPVRSSPATFDPSGGTHAAQSLTALEGRKLQFDVVQWLSGDDANDAYVRESGDDSGAPNDYYIANERDELRIAPVADEAVILVLRADGYAGSLHTVPFDSIPIDDPHRTFWLTFTDGAITEICQQYRP